MRASISPRSPKTKKAKIKVDVFLNVGHQRVEWMNERMLNMGFKLFFLRPCSWSKVRFITLFSGNNWRKQKPENKPFFRFFVLTRKRKSRFQFVYSFLRFVKKTKIIISVLLFVFWFLLSETNLPLNIWFPPVGGSSYWLACFIALCSS